MARCAAVPHGRKPRHRRVQHARRRGISEKQHREIQRGRCIRKRGIRLLLSGLSGQKAARDLSERMRGRDDGRRKCSENLLRCAADVVCGDAERCGRQGRCRKVGHPRAGTLSARSGRRVSRGKHRKGVCEWRSSRCRRRTDQFSGEKRGEVHRKCPRTQSLLPVRKAPQRGKRKRHTV